MVSSRQLSRYFHTVRHLQFKQIFFRLYYACQKVKLQPIKKQRLHDWQQIGKWPGFSISCLSQSGEFNFLGDKGNINDIGIWSDQTYPKLWIYNLHYLHELNAAGADSRYEVLDQLIEKWVSKNPPYEGNGWEPYPLSLRIVNLVKWYSKQNNSIKQEWLSSLEIQAEALTKQVEYHILANHLFANGKALVFVGAYFNGQAAARWLKKGLRILDREIKEQFLNDGAHFELSPMYHASLLWDMCDLLNLANQSGFAELLLRKKEWQIIIEKGLSWLLAMLHPDGGISFFNDAAFDIAPEYSAIKKYAEQLGINVPKNNNDNFSLQWLKESGYCVVNLGGGSKAILDVAKIGPDYQPGHAHADTLSFELSLHGHRLLVNSGISCYGEDNLRQFQRSTKAHNTVCIEGADSSEVWAGFRVARRAYPKDLSICDEPNRIVIRCSHDGYLRLPGRPIHRREWDFKRNHIMIRDLIIGQFEEAEVRYYLHPDVGIVVQQQGRVECYFSSGQKAIINVLDANLIIESSNWYPAFGVAVESHCLVIKFKGSELLTQVEW